MLEFTERLLLHVRINQLSDNGSLFAAMFGTDPHQSDTVFGFSSLPSRDKIEVEKVLDSKRFQIGNPEERLGKRRLERM